MTLAGEHLFLASVENGPDAVLNEYIRKNETFENWKVLFAVRQVRSARTVDEVVARWKAYLSQVKSPGMSLREDESSTPSDRRFTLAIRPPGDSYLENDELRFIPAPNGKGVIYYQAAVRTNPTDEAELRASFPKLVALGEALQTISVQPIERMP